MFFDGAVVYDNQATECLLFSTCVDPNITRIISIYTGYQAMMVTISDKSCDEKLVELSSQNHHPLCWRREFKEFISISLAWIFNSNNELTASDI